MRKAARLGEEEEACAGGHEGTDHEEGWAEAGLARGSSEAASLAPPTGPAPGTAPPEGRRAPRGRLPGGGSGRGGGAAEEREAGPSEAFREEPWGAWSRRAARRLLGAPTWWLSGGRSVRWRRRINVRFVRDVRFRGEGAGRAASALGGRRPGSVWSAGAGLRGGPTRSMGALLGNTATIAVSGAQPGA